MAAMMSGLEGRLFPRSLSRGRESSPGASHRRSSSLDSRLSRSVSPSNRSFQSHSHSRPTTPTSNKAKALKMETPHNKSDEALVKPSDSMPTYVKPAEHGESGERMAKDVFDRDNKIIESSSSDDEDDDDEDDDDDYEGSDDDEQIPGVAFVTVPRGRKKQKEGDDITTITSRDFDKLKDADSNITKQGKWFPLCRPTSKFTNALSRESSSWAQHPQHGQEATQVCPEDRGSSSDQLRNPNSSRTLRGWYSTRIR